MSLVTKPDFNLIFASQAPSVDLPPQFNNYVRGMDETRKNNGKPTIKQFNYLHQNLDLKLLWILQNGAALPYDSSVEYAENSLALKDGELQQLVDGVWSPLKKTVDASDVKDESGKTQQDINDTVQSRLAEVISVEDFGAVGDGVTDSTDAFEAALAYARTKKTAHIVIPQGEFVVSRHLLFDPPAYSVIECNGRILSTLESAVLATIGSPDSARFFYDVRGFSIRYKNTYTNISNDTGGNSIALRLLNVVFSRIEVREARFCYVGLRLDGSLGSGSCAYNQIFIGSLKDNVVCLHLKPSTAVGWVNENTIYGGSYGQAGSFPYSGNEHDIKFETFSGDVNVNNNLIFRPSLESFGADTIAASIEGKYNKIYMPRLENVNNGTYFPIIFQQNTLNCSIEGGGWALTLNKITDLGVGNSYETQTGNVLKNSGRTENLAAFTYQNISSNLEKTIGVIDTAAALKWWVNGVGNSYGTGYNYAGAGVRWATVDGTYIDRGIFVRHDAASNTSARVGSLHVNTTSGNVSVKISGALTSDGWKRVQYVDALATNPSSSLFEVGQHYFNTTLGKPVWWNGTSWVDAAGVVV